MIDIKLLRTNLDEVSEKLKERNFVLDIDKFIFLESKRKELQVEVEELKAKKNANSKSVGLAKSKNQDISFLVEGGIALNESLEVIEESLNKIQKEIDEILWSIPNILHESVPVGTDDSENVEVRRFKEPTKFDFKPKDHVDLGERLECMDFEAAAKISGSRFVVLYGQLAKLQRALIQFMLDVHTKEHGYREVYVPYLVNRESMFGAGKLPKFEDDNFFTTGAPSFSLIPTTEVPLTNLVRDSILESNKLPMKFVGHSTNFRKESGSYGRDVRGMIRQHQFEKVELVQIVCPENSYDALEEMTKHAEAILQKLELPYRVMLLCSGDTGFCATKTYDLEVWLSGQNQYREISSCSNCEDFQARRMQARFRNPKTNKTEFVHMLNGSGLAVGRTLIAVMENYQDKYGRIHIPTILQPYMNGLKVF